MVRHPTAEREEKGKIYHHENKKKVNNKHIKQNQKRQKTKCREIMSGILKSLLVNFVCLFQILLDNLLEFALSIYLGPKKTCPALNENDFITKSAVDLAQMIRERKLKSYDVVKAYIDRIQAINGILNAVADGPFMEALDEAKKIDELIENGQITENDFNTKPFLGLPFTTKDSTAVKDKLHTLGLLSRKNEHAKEDAECVRLMKEAGAIIIATTNVPEVNKWMETRNLLFGQTNNPYDTRRSVGGSSGGEATLVSACGTAFGLGTDIGGSIRIPAFNCGIFGHKSTTGLINMKGCTFRTGKETSTMVTAGPMTRYATDLLPLFKILVGPENVIKCQLNDKVDVKKLKYYYIPANNDIKCLSITKDIEKAMFKTINHFANITGQQVVLASLPGLEKSSRLWRYWMTQEPTDYNILLGNGIMLNPIVELTKKLLGQSNFTMAAIYSLIDSILPKEKSDEIREITRKCDEELTKLLGDNGILFYHSSPRTTPFHYYSLVRFNDFHYFSIFNVLQVPATQVPLGLDSKGLPLGIQVVATRNRDKDCLAVAVELEKAFGGWVPPFVINKN